MRKKETDPTNGLVIGDNVQVVGSKRTGTIMETRVAHRIKDSLTAQLYFYGADDLVKVKK